MTACERAREREAHLGLLVRRVERQHAVDRLRRVRRVQRREHEVARVGRLERRVERLEVADLADEDDVRDPDAARGAAPARSSPVSVPTSRWLMWQLMSRCRNSIGSSIVMMFALRCSLMCWIIAASAVDLPDPVMPGDEHEAARLAARSPRAPSAGCSSSIVRAWYGIARIAYAIVPRCWYALHAEAADARHADREVALLVLGELLHLLRRHQLLRRAPSGPPGAAPASRSGDSSPFTRSVGGRPTFR